MVTFGRRIRKSFLDFYLAYNRFCFKVLRPIQQELEMVIYEKIYIEFRVFLIFKGLNEKFFRHNLYVNSDLNVLKPLL